MFNKQADQLIAEQDKVSVESQRENDGKKKRRHQPVIKEVGCVENEATSN